MRISSSHAYGKIVAAVLIAGISLLAGTTYFWLSKDKGVDYARITPDAARKGKDAPHPPRILYVNSYHPGYTWSDQILASIQDELLDEFGKNVDLRVEYLDAKRFGPDLKGALGDEIEKVWAKKYAGQRFDLLLVSDQDGYDFLGKLRDRLFPDAPMVFAGVEDPGRIAGNTTGVMASTDYKGNIELILSMLPGTKRIWLVADNTVTGMVNRGIMKKVAPEFKGRVEIHFLGGDDGVRRDALVKMVRELNPREDVVFFMDYYVTPSGQSVDLKVFLPVLTDASSVPVFSHLDLYVTLGVVGGRVNSGSAQGRQMAELGAKIIKGMRADKHPVEVERTILVFNYDRLKKFNIPMSATPMGSKIINQPHGFWTDYGAYFISAMIFIAFQGFLIAWLVVLVKRQRFLRRKVEHSEAQFKAFFDLAPFGFTVSDIDGRCLMANQAFCRQTGFSQGQAAGRTQSELGLVLEREVWDELTLKGHVADKEAVSMTTNGELRHVIYSSRILDLGDGRVVLSSLLDVTDRRKIEEAVRESEVKYRRLHESMMDGFVSTSLDGRLLDFNSAYCDMLGYSADELRSMTYQDLTPESWRAMEKEIIDGQVLQRKYSDIYEKEYVRKNGEVFPVELRTYLAYDSSGGPCGLWAIVRDISARKKDEASLQRRNAMFEAQTRIMLSLIAEGVLMRGDIKKALEMITEACAETIQVERVSVWSYDEGSETINCMDLFERGRRRHGGGEELCCADFPAYASAHAQGKVIAAVDVFNDNRTKELPDSYYLEYDIKSLLDAPVWAHDRIAGLLSFENVGSQRSWTQEEERFAMNMSSLLSLCFESADRKKVEGALKENEARLRTLVENIPGVSYRCAMDEDWTMEFISDEIKKLSGYPPSDFIGSRGRSYGSMIHPDDRAAVWDRVVESVGEKRAFGLEYRIIQADGGVRWVYDKGQAVRGPDGNVAFLDGVILDITDRKNSEAALRRSEQMYTAIFNNSNDALLIHDPLGTILDVNARMCELYGYTRDEVMSLTLADLSQGEPPYTIENAKRKINAALEEGPQTFEWLGRRKGGDLIWLEVMLCSFKMESMTMVMAVVRDITERKRTESLMLEREARYRTLFESSRDAVIIMEAPEWSIIEANQAACEMFKAKFSDFVGRHPWEFSPALQPGNIPTQEKAKILMGQAIAEGGASFEWVHKDFEGNEFICSVLLSKCELPGRVIVQASIRDITVQKQVEGAIRERESLLKEAERIANLGNWIWNVGEGVMMWSDGFHRIFGTEPGGADVSYEGFLSMVHPDDRERVKRENDEALSDKTKSYFTDYRIVRSDGRERVVHAQAEVTRAPDGSPVCMLGTVQDITDLKHAESELRESENRFRTMMEQSPFSIMIFSPEGKILKVNAAHDKLWGGLSQDAIDKYDIFADAQLESLGVMPLVARAFQGERISVPPLEYDLARSLGEGGRKTIKGDFYPIRDQSGKVRHVVVVHQDISEQRAAQAELDRTLEKMNQIIEFLPDATMVVDKDGVVIAWNRAMEVMTGVSKREMIGKGNQEYSIPFYGERRQILIDLALSTDEEFLCRNYSGVQRLKNGVCAEAYTPSAYNGKGGHMWAFASRLYDKDGNVAGAIEAVRDVTDKKKVEDEVRESENRFRTMIEQAPFSISLFTPDGMLIQVNEAHFKLWGDIPEAKYKSYNILEDHQLEAMGLMAIVRRAFNGERVSTVPVEYDLEKTLGVGFKKVIQGDFYPIRDNDGRIRYVVLIHQDRTEEMNARKQLDDTLERMNQIIEFLPDATIVVDKYGVIIAWNRAIEEMTGVSKQDMIGKGNQEYTIPFYGERRKALIDLVLSVDDEFLRGHYKGVEVFNNGVCGEAYAPMMHNGRGGYLWAFASRLYDKDGNMTGVIETIRDITDRKRAEDEIRQSWDRYKALVAVSNTGAWEYDSGSGTLWCSREYYSMLGYEKDGDSYTELGLGTWLEMLHPDDRDAASGRFSEYLLGGSVGTYESYFRMRHADGSWRWIWSRGQTLRNQDGSVSAKTIGAHIDITERKLAEEKLQGIADSVPGVIYQFYAKKSGERGMYFVSQHAEGLFGISKDTATFFPEFKSRVAPECLESFMNSIDVAVRNSTPWDYEGRFVRPDGREIYFKGISHPVKSGDEAVFTGVLLDITDRIRAERALRDSERRFRLIFETAPYSIVINRIRDGAYMMVNKAFADSVGLPVDMIEGRTRDSLGIRHDPAEVERINKIFREKGRLENELVRTSSGGREKFSQVNTVVFELDGEQHALSILVDITDRVDAEKALRESEAKYRRLVEELGKEYFFYNHDTAGNFTYLSPTITDMLGYAPEEFMTHYSTNMTSNPVNAEAVRLTELGMKGLRQRPFELEVFHRDGTTRWLEVADVPIIGEDGEVVEVEGLAKDITSRKFAEEELREREELFKKMFQNAPYVMGLLDAECGVCIDANDRLLEVSGFSREEFVGKNSADLGWLSEEVVKRINDALARDGQLRGLEFDARRKDGRILKMTLNAEKIVAHGKTMILTSGDDITERKLAEEELREREELFKKMFRNAPYLTVLRDSEYGVCIDANDRLLEVSGFSREEFVGKTSTEIGWFSQETVARIRAALDRDGRIVGMEIQATCKDGRTLWLIVNAEQIVVHGRSLILISGDDITEVKQTREELIKYRDHLEEVVRTRTAEWESANKMLNDEIAERKGLEAKLQVANFMSDTALALTKAGCWHVPLNGSGYYIGSENTSAIFGYPPRPPDYRYLLDNEWGENIAAADPVAAKRVVANLDKTFSGEVDLFDETYLYKRPNDGRIVWIHDVGRLVRDVAGRPTDVYGACQDITDYKTVVEQLRFSQERFMMAIQGSGDGLWEYTPETDQMWFSPRINEMLGEPAEESVGSLSESMRLAHPDDAPGAIEKIRKLAAGEESLELELRMMARGGEYRWFRARAKSMPGRSGGSRLVRGLFSDITIRRRMDQDIREAKEAAEAANKAKSVFLANMSHELRTPLNAILGFSQFMDRDPSLSDDARRNLSIVNRAGQHLLSMINDVLDLSKIEAGKVELNEEAFDLVQTVEDLMEMLRSRGHAKGLKVSLEMDPKIKRHVRADLGKLRQILINLIGNAVKFTDAGGVVMRVRSRALKKGGGMMLDFEVEDTGQGISEDKLDEIFEPFKQVGPAKEGSKGTGLGLTISKTFARLMDGEIKVSSRLGEGSVFTLSIPVGKASKKDVSPEYEPSKVVVGLADGQPEWRVLIAEDNQENKQLLESLLGQAGFKVRTVENGMEAVSAAKSWLPHFIWMDMRMPVMDGYEATRRIRKIQECEGVKIVALTASAFKEQEENILDAGCDEVMHKPYKQWRIFETMERLLGVKFKYAGPKEAPHEKKGGEPSGPVSFDNLPPGTVERIHQAALELDKARILELARSLESERPLVAKLLRKKAESYDFETLEKLTRNIKMGGDS